ncbi:MAG: hypothetical protein ACUVUC_06945 [Thermoguttaceae bacterium]
MSSEPASPPADPLQDPGYARVRDFLLHGLSLPERTLRSATGVLSGTLRDSAALLLPQAFRNSKTYCVLVQQMLDFLAEDVGGLERSGDPIAPPKIENFVARKTVGNFIELASLATLHLSPMLLLAVVSDLAYGSKAYLKELAGDLKRRGVIARDSTIDSLEDLLEAVGSVAGTASGAFDAPPLSVEGLKQTVEQTRRAVARIDPATIIPLAELIRLWDEIHALAASQNVSPLALSGAVTLYGLERIAALGTGALSTVRSAVVLFDRHVIDHYRTGLKRVAEKGLYAVLRETSRPYIDAVWKNFSSQKPTLTEAVLSGRWMVRAWGAVRRWLAGG